MKDVIPIPVLILDDDERLARRLADWLVTESFPTAAFSSLAAALEHASVAQPRVMLVDLRMPEVDGAAAIRALGQASPRAGIIAMSAFPDAAELAQAREAGAGAILEKPIDAERLLATVTHEVTRLGVVGRTEAELNRRIGARLKAVRQACGRTQVEVAAQVGLVPSQLSQIETGRTGTTNWTLARLCAALDISLADLLARA